MSVARRVLILLVLVLLVVPAYGARKRRSTNAPGGNAGGNTGQCHVFGFVRPGLKASYLSTTSTGSATYTITYLEDTATRARTTQDVQTPQGTAIAETTIDVETVGILRGMKKVKVATSISVPFVGNVTTTVDIDFVPSLILGPAEGWCVGNTWDVAPVTETITTSLPIGGNQTQVVTTVGGSGEVLAVGAPVTAAGRTFSTVKYRHLTLAGQTVQPAVTWVSMADGEPVVVKQETLDANGAVTTSTIITALN